MLQNRAFFRQEPKLRNAVLNMPGRNPQRGWSHKGAESTARLNNAGNAHLTDEKVPRPMLQARFFYFQRQLS